LEALPQITDALSRGPVIFDRYFASALVYGGLDGLDASWLYRAQMESMPKPNLYLLLDIPVEESIRRRPERRDRYESNIEYMNKVRTAYRALWAEKTWQLIDGVGTIEEVTHRIMKSILPLCAKIASDADLKRRCGM
jgi:thymidylate kinase